MTVSLGAPLCRELFQTNNSKLTVTWKNMPSSSIVYNDICLVPNKHVIAIFYITSLISSQPHISTLKIYVCLYLYLHILCIIYTHIYTYI